VEHGQPPDQSPGLGHALGGWLLSIAFGGALPPEYRPQFIQTCCVLGSWHRRGQNEGGEGKASKDSSELQMQNSSGWVQLRTTIRQEFGDALESQSYRRLAGNEIQGALNWLPHLASSSSMSSNKSHLHARRRQPHRGVMQRAFDGQTKS